MINLDNAYAETDEVVNSLGEVVGSITRDITAELDNQIAKLKKGVDTFSNGDLREIMACISVETYYVGIAKEQSSLRDACATALYKEGMAKVFAVAPGAVEAKKQQAVTGTMDKQAVSILYTTVTNLLKTKIDEAHRIVSVINGILMSRASDAKQYYNPRSEQDTMDMNNNE